MLGYTIAFCVVALLAVVLGSPVPVIGIVAASLVWAIAHWGVYAYKLRAFGRARSPQRASGDRVVSVETFACACVLGAAGVVAVTGGWHPHASGVSVTHLAQGFAVGAGGFGLLLASSVFDWYWIVPRRDGLLCEPPCLTSGARQWRRLTKAWLWHRCIATIVGTLLFVIGIALLVWAFAPHVPIDGASGPAAFAGALGVTAAVLKFTPYSEALGSWSAFGPPILCVGDKLNGLAASGKRVDGMLLDISLDQVHVGGSHGQQRTYRIADLWRGNVEPSSFSECNADYCAHVIENCARWQPVHPDHAREDRA